jgi:hypothetical protein
VDEVVEVSADPGGMNRRTFLASASATIAGLPSMAAARDRAGSAARWPRASSYGARVPAAWFDLALELVRTTPGFSPPVAARAFGYAGVTLYEALVPGMPDRRSLAGRIGGLTRLPPPGDLRFHWPTVANSALASILRSLFPTTPEPNLEAIDALDRRFSQRSQEILRHGTYRRSTARGADVAGHVFEWSKTDGGHEGFLRNLPPYVRPRGPGLWEPTPPAFLPALQPYWGTNRPFLPMAGETCSPRPPLAYSDDPCSAFYAEAYECYLALRDLTPEQEAIARFWSDEPGLSATPAGHWISIVTQLVRALDVPLSRAAEAYAKVGIAVADAFVSCWRTKYQYNVLRPVTYVRRLIDPAWTTLLVTPPFPEYTSGHSVQSAAAARVLTDLFGPVSFTDRTHAPRGLPARSFDSFLDAAREAAISRLYGGIHFRDGIERGVEQGLCIGKQVRSLGCV